MKRIILKHNNFILLNSYLNSIKEDKDLKKFDNFEDFASTLLQVNLFDNRKDILVLLELKKEFLGVLIELMKSNFDNDMILVQREEIKDKEYNVLKELCEIVELKEPTKEQCITIVQKMLDAKGVKYRSEVPVYLVSVIGHNFIRLYNEVNKLIDFCTYDVNNTKILTVEDINVLCETNKDGLFFKLSDVLFRKKFKEFFELFESLDETSYIGFIIFLITTVEKMYKILKYKKIGYSIKEISDFVELPVYILKNRILPYFVYFDDNRLVSLLKILNNINMELRRLNYSKELIVLSNFSKIMKA